MSKFSPDVLARLLAERATGALQEATGVGTELSTWWELVAGADLSDWAERYLFDSLCDPSATTFAELAANMTRGPHGCALVCAAFSNVEIVCAWDNDDERTYLAGLSPAPSGHHRVYWFVARFLELDSNAWPSISSFVANDMAGGLETLEPAEPQHLDPIVLSQRSTWLTCALAGVGTGSLEHDTRDAATIDAYCAERDAIAEHAHLACYWLLHHFIAGNTDLLDETVERSTQCSHPWVAELRRLLSAAATGNLRLGAIDDRFLERFAQSAPDTAFAG